MKGYAALKIENGALRRHIEELEARLRRSNDDYEDICRWVLEECGYDPDEPGLDVLPDEAATNVREARDRLREVVTQQANVLLEAMRVADEDNTNECLSYDEAGSVEAALRAALEER